MPTPSSFYELARISTGAHFLDSGYAYGRHWEKPPVPEDHPLYYARRWGEELDQIDLLVNQPSALDAAFTIDPKATRHFRLWAALADPHDDKSYFELARLYCARMLMTGRWEDRDTRDLIRRGQTAEEIADSMYCENSYNCDNNLDQDYEIIAPSPYGGWALILSHNGCDIRGGYSTPVVARGEGAASVETDIRPWCPTCNAEADSLYSAQEHGWKVFRLPDRAILVCPNGHRAAPEFPYTDGQEPDDDRTAEHEPEPDSSESYCTFCGGDLVRDGDNYSCRPILHVAPTVPREQLALAI